MAEKPTPSRRNYISDNPSENISGKPNPNAIPHIDIVDSKSNAHIYTLNDVAYIPVFRTNLTNTFNSPRQKMYVVFAKGIETSNQTMQFWQISFISNDIRACLRNIDKYLKDPKLNGNFSKYGFDNVVLGEIIPIDNFVLAV